MTESLSSKHAYCADRSSFSSTVLIKPPIMIHYALKQSILSISQKLHEKYFRKWSCIHTRRTIVFVLITDATERRSPKWLTAYNNQQSKSSAALVCEFAAVRIECECSACGFWLLRQKKEGDDPKKMGNWLKLTSKVILNILAI